MEKMCIYYDDFYQFLNSNLKQLDEFKNQYIDLLNELTKCPDLDKDIFYHKIKEINNNGKIIIAYTIDNNKIKIIGSGTIIIESKIIHQGRSVGHIEDIVVNSNYRGNNISQLILNRLKEVAKLYNCYKVILDCDITLTKVYEKNGFEIKGIQMSQYFD